MGRKGEPAWLMEQMIARKRTLCDDARLIWDWELTPLSSCDTGDDGSNVPYVVSSVKRGRDSQLSLRDPDRR